MIFRPSASLALPPQDPPWLSEDGGFSTSLCPGCVDQHSYRTSLSLNSGSLTRESSPSFPSLCPENDDISGKPVVINTDISHFSSRYFHEGCNCPALSLVLCVHESMSAYHGSVRGLLLWPRSMEGETESQVWQSHLWRERTSSNSLGGDIRDTSRTHRASLDMTSVDENSNQSRRGVSKYPVMCSCMFSNWLP